MPLPWVRLDTTFPDNPKTLTLIKGYPEGKASAFVYLCGLAYAGRHGTDGFLPREALPYLHGRSSDAEKLEKVGLWDPVPGGWMIHGWDEFQVSDQEKRGRSARARRAAEARWSTP